MAARFESSTKIYVRPSISALFRSTTNLSQQAVRPEPIEGCKGSGRRLPSKKPIDSSTVYGGRSEEEKSDCKDTMGNNRNRLDSSWRMPGYQELKKALLGKL